MSSCAAAGRNDVPASHTGGNLPNHSVIVGGLEYWTKGDEIQEPRLVAKLKDLLRVDNLALYAPPPDNDDPSSPQKTGITSWQFPESFIAVKVAWLLETVNRYLSIDGWEIAPRAEMSGRPIYAARRRIEGASFAVNQAQRVADVLGASYISQQITRMELAVEKDPELAIGTAKEFVETICKTVLRQCSVTLHGGEDLPQLAKLTLKQLKLTPDTLPDGSRASDTIRVLLGNLSTIAHKLAELRNTHGSGHGKDAATNTLAVRHARLAAGAAIAFGVFVFETHQAGDTGL